MAKRRAKRTVKQVASSPVGNADGADLKEAPVGKKEGFTNDQEVERRTAATRAIRDVEVEQLLTGLRLLRSYFKEEQLQTPVLQFFRDNLPNLSIVKNGKDGQYEVQWKEKDGNLSIDQVHVRNIHASLLQQMSIAYRDCSAATPSLGGFDFSSKAEKASLFGADNFRIKDFVMEEQSDSRMFGLQDGLQTPAVSGQRLSVGMTPKTLRLPKHGEMLLSVHGSPLGVFKEDNKEDNMEAIHESEEG